MKKIIRKIAKPIVQTIDNVRYQYECKKLNYIPERQKSSISDDHAYPAICLAASRDESVFRNFRRNFIYNRILEHVSREEGNDYLNVINENVAFLFTDIDWEEFCKNDLYGNPRVYSYRINDRSFNLSPTTLRYVKVLQDLLSIFKMDKIKSVAEIGIGYAGECRILTSYLQNIKEYSLFDIPETLELAKKYLGKFGNGDKFQFVDGTKVNVEKEYDLVISNYAFSELVRDVQDIYMEKVILKSKAGYITWNPGASQELGGYSVEELLGIIPGSSVVEERPLSGAGNCIIVWGNI